LSTEHVVGGISAEPGTSASGRLRLLKLPDGTDLESPIIVFRGVQEGPRLYIGAATHGDEVNGVEICRRLAETLDPKKLTGSVMIVPVHNPVAFRLRQRINPIDHTDLNRVFPGRENGSATEMLTHRLYREIVAQASFIIDLHSAAVGGRYCGPVLFVPDTGNDAGRESLRLARIFGGDVIIHTKLGKEYEGYLLDRTLTMVTAVNGIPGLCAELGVASILDEEYIKIGLKGIENVMKSLGMIEGRPETSSRNLVCSELVAVRSRSGGLLHVRIKAGAELKRDELLAQVYSPLSRVEDITAPVDGIAVRVQTAAVCLPGDRIVCLGRTEEK
jgi:predicted deacylase